MAKKISRKTPVSRITDWGWVMEHQNGTERRYSKLEENQGDMIRLCYSVMPPRGYAFIRIKRKEITLGEARWHLEFRNLMYFGGKPIPQSYLNILLNYKDSFFAIGERYPEEQLTLRKPSHAPRFSS